MGLRYMTAGESHGKGLMGIIDGYPAGIPISNNDFKSLLSKRWRGYGRSKRKNIETDQVEIIAGVYKNFTTGAPIGLFIKNNDYITHSEYMNPLSNNTEAGKISVLRPGHADYAGIVKYSLDDIRPIRERASARETAMRTALSAPARIMLKELGIQFVSFVESMGGIQSSLDYSSSYSELNKKVEANGEEFLSCDSLVIPKWKKLIDEQSSKQLSVGGTACSIIYNLPVGLGSHVQYDRRIDAKIAALVASIPAVRGIEFGFASKNSASLETTTDSLFSDKNGTCYRTSNFAAGIEGGMTNGEPLIVRIHVKPVPTHSGVKSINYFTKQAAPPDVYRSDIQAVTGVVVIAESIILTAIASEVLDKLGGDNLKEILKRYKK